MTYNAFWRKQNPGSVTSKESPFSGLIKSLTKTASRNQGQGSLVQVRLRPYGSDGAASLVIEEASPKAKCFKVVSEQRFTGDDGARQAIEAYRQLQEKFMSPGADAATPLFCEACLFPEDLADARAKTADEHCLDQAQLCLEIEEFEAAENWLKRVSEHFFEESMFAHTVARRLYMNWSRKTDGDSEARQKLAAEHAVNVIRLYKQMAAEDQYAAQRVLYYFGDHYKSAATQLVCACETAADLILNTSDRADIALNYCEYGEATNYGGGNLYRLKIKALLKLDRAPEAWKVFALWQRSLGDMPEITNSPGYQQFIAGQNAASDDAQRARLAAIRISYADGQPAGEGEIDALRHRFPAFGERWPAQLRDARQAILQVEDGDIVSIYRRFSPQESLDAHAEMLSWIHLHDGNPEWPEFAAERDASLKESGIDPEKMLPIIGGQATPDCYLLRLDGGAGECGAVYLWSHEELASFDKIVDDIDEIFPYLADCGRQGFHCL